MTATTQTSADHYNPYIRQYFLDLYLTEKECIFWEKHWTTQIMGGKSRLLSFSLIDFGAVFCLVLPLSMVWPSGWSWHGGPPMASHYFMMIVGVYATLGVFLIRAARDPMAHSSLIWFTVWSSIVHAVIMAVQAVGDPMQRGHLFGDVPALLVAAAVLAILMPRRAST